MVSSSGMAVSEKRWRRSSSDSPTGARVPSGAGEMTSSPRSLLERRVFGGGGGDDLVAGVMGRVRWLCQEVLRSDELRNGPAGRDDCRLAAAHAGRIAHPRSSAARTVLTSPMGPTEPPRRAFPLAGDHVDLVVAAGPGG